MLRFVLALNSVFNFWGLWVFEFLISLPVRYTVSVCSSSDNCPARCAASAEIVCEIVDILK
jgi:hypothetical protein